MKTNADIVYEFNKQLAAFRAEFHMGGADGKQPHPDGSPQSVHGNEYDQAKNVIEKFHADFKKTIDGYGENGVNVSKPILNKEGFYAILVSCDSATVAKRLEGKLSRRINRGGFATITHSNPKSFIVMADAQQVNALYPASDISGGAQ